jgi:GrpB-like predicted nucleotidyltransferase (UPF0157 family)
MKIEVVPYNYLWSVWFEAERSAIRDALGDVLMNVHHIGSTAVEGLAAKPVIDIILEVQSLEALDESTIKMECLGYEALGEFGIAGRRYFRKGGSDRTHQVHSFRIGDDNIFRHLAFRFSPDVRLAYEALKRKLALDCDNDIEIYCDGKDAFVRLHEAKAIAWKKVSG